MVRFLRSSSSPLCLFSLIILMLCLLFKLEEEPVVDLPGKKKCMCMLNYTDLTMALAYISFGDRRGWQEKDNTWEPYEHIQRCSDILEKFENRCACSIFLLHKKNCKHTLCFCSLLLFVWGFCRLEIRQHILLQP